MYASDSSPNPSLEGRDFFPFISSSLGERLEREREEEDVKVVIVDCVGDMAPRPDGFKYSFIQVPWDVLKTDFYAMKSEFHRIGRLSKKINATSLTVIPKVTNTMDIMESRLANQSDGMHV
eukprot:TRINITY_DN8959_c1_g1_i3.p3 TRINITY_DN8959_c1_g1~~TRINITY_DN8959_c1_g1_i3.p3  ORF type:complete len:121 (+),score=25.61 TRINITY_DN8959_c1_g1_i3:919-1281(+)